MLDTQKRIGLTRLVYFVEGYLETPESLSDPPEEIRGELIAAIKSTRELLAAHRPPAGEFFTLAAKEPKEIKP